MGRRDEARTPLNYSELDGIDPLSPGVRAEALAARQGLDHAAANRMLRH
jgi:hypothetical protein